MLRIAEELCHGGRPSTMRPSYKNQHPITEISDNAQLLRDQQHGPIRFCCTVFPHLVQENCGLNGGQSSPLVGSSAINNLGLEDKRNRDQSTLRHAARQLVGHRALHPPFGIVNAHKAQHLDRLLTYLGRGWAVLWAR